MFLDPTPLILWVLVGYLLGSIPFGVIVTRLAGVGDVRNIGSGNIGATNVLRTGRRDLALVTLLTDGGKGAAAVLLANWLAHSPGLDTAYIATVAGGAAFVGHLFPVWLTFKGGKGVATFFGTLIAVTWPAGLAAGAVWILMALVFRFSSLAALAALALSPVLVWLLDQSEAGKLDHIWLAVFMALLSFIRHHENIRRLLKGEEPRIGAKAAVPARPEAESDPEILGHNGGPALSRDDK
ncbi:MAG TPA: glycerol-3-phosphate 1-O-acyltransferase PlsY [Caulobacteraceae bacterium]|jgi:glycerol-3-phosphate acyltransferase PlsY